MLLNRFIFGLISLCLMTMKCSDGAGSCSGSFMRGVYPCPPAWEMWGEKCYKKMGMELPWAEAKQECLKTGGHLVMPLSQQETEFLLKNVYPWFWINCNDLEVKGAWVCQDGTSDVEYRNWGKTQPSNSGGGEHCAHAGTGGWNDISCQRKIPVICQQPKLHY